MKTCSKLKCSCWSCSSIKNSLIEKIDDIVGEYRDFINTAIEKQYDYSFELKLEKLKYDTKEIDLILKGLF